ncbi:hypothetical protein AVEN_201506-1, partial [Araneus ventricosus]
TINAARYCHTLTKLKSAIRRQRPGLLSRGFLFLHDNGRPNTARDTKEHIRRLVWERLMTRPTAQILHHRIFTFFLHRSQHYRKVTSEAIKRCDRL